MTDFSISSVSTRSPSVEPIKNPYITASQSGASLRREIAYQKSENVLARLGQHIADLYIRIMGGERTLDLVKGDNEHRAIQGLVRIFQAPYEAGDTKAQVSKEKFMQMVREQYNPRTCVAGRFDSDMRIFFGRIEQCCDEYLQGLEHRRDLESRTASDRGISESVEESRNSVEESISESRDSEFLGKNVETVSVAPEWFG